MAATNTLLFETLFCVLGGVIIGYAYHKKCPTVSAIPSIESEIEAERNKTEDQATNVLESLFERRDELVNELTSKNMFFVKVRWRSLAEKRSKYFHNIPKRNRASNICKKIVNRKSNDGQQQTTTETDVMLE